MDKGKIKDIEDRISIALSKRREKKVTGANVELVGVTKNHSFDTITDAIKSGIRHIGENRVQEAKNKFIFLEEELCNVSLHLIGHLQTNKTKDAVKIFNLIESVDSIHLMEEIEKEAFKINKIQDVLFQINIANEPQKNGFSIDEYKHAVDIVKKFGHINLRGLMIIAPVTDNSETVRPVFEKAYLIYKDLKDKYPVDILSMGMTNDFEIAIQEGANEIRIGRALFGERDYSLRF